MCTSEHLRIRIIMTISITSISEHMYIFIALHYSYNAIKLYMIQCHMHACMHAHFCAYSFLCMLHVSMMVSIYVQNIVIIIQL